MKKNLPILLIVLILVSSDLSSQELLENTAHNVDLRENEHMVVNIDYQQMGVGRDNSWGLPVLGEYLIKPGNYSYGFTLQPVNMKHKDE